MNKYQQLSPEDLIKVVTEELSPENVKLGRRDIADALILAFPGQGREVMQWIEEKFNRGTGRERV